jgi:hypothetical protein
VSGPSRTVANQHFAARDRGEPQFLRATTNVAVDTFPASGGHRFHPENEAAEMFPLAVMLTVLIVEACQCVEGGRNVRVPWDEHISHRDSSCSGHVPLSPTAPDSARRSLSRAVCWRRPSGGWWVSGPLLPLPTITLLLVIVGPSSSPCDHNVPVDTFPHPERSLRFQPLRTRLLRCVPTGVCCRLC